MLNQNLLLNDSLGALYLTAPDELAKREHYEAGCKIENSQSEKENFLLIEENDFMIDSVSHKSKIAPPSHEIYSRNPIEKKDVILLPHTSDSYEDDESIKPLNIIKKPAPNSLSALNSIVPDEFAKREHNEAGCKIENYQLKKEKILLIEENEIMIDSFSHKSKIAPPSHEIYSRNPVEKKDIIPLPHTSDSYKDDESIKPLNIIKKPAPNSLSALNTIAPDNFAKREHNEAGCKFEKYQLKKEIFRFIEEIDIVINFYNNMNKIASPSHEGYSRKMVEKKDITSLFHFFDDYETLKNRNSKLRTKLTLDSTFDDLELYVKQYCKECILSRDQCKEKCNTSTFDGDKLAELFKKAQEHLKNMKLENEPQKSSTNTLVSRMNSFSFLKKKSTTISEEIIYESSENCDAQSNVVGKEVLQLEEINERILELICNYMDAQTPKTGSVISVDVDQVVPQQNNERGEGGPRLLKAHGDETETEIKEAPPLSLFLRKYASVKEISSVKNFFEKVFKAEPTFKTPNFKKLVFEKPNFKNLTFSKPVFEKLNFHFKIDLFHKQNQSSDPTNEVDSNIVDERLERDSTIEASNESYDDSVVLYFLDPLSPTSQDHSSKFNYDELLLNEGYLRRIIVERDVKNCLQINANNQLRRILEVGTSQLEELQIPFISPIENVNDIQSWSLEELEDARKALKNQHTRLQLENEHLRIMLVLLRNLDLEILDRIGFKPQEINIEDIIDSYKLEIDDLNIKIDESDSQIKELRSRNKWKTLIRSVRNKMKEDMTDDEAPKMPEVDADGKLDVEALHLYTQYLRTVYEKKSMELNTYLGKKETSSKSVDSQLILLELKQEFRNILNACSSSVAGGDKKNVTGVSADVDNYKLEIDDLKNKIEELDSQTEELRSRNKWSTFMRSLKIRYKMKEDKNEDEAPEMPEVDEDGMLDVEALRLYTQHLRTIYEKKSMELNTYLGKKETSSKSVVTSEVEDQAIKNNEDANDKPTEPPDPTHEEGLNIVDKRLECIPERVTGVSADIDKYKLEIDDLKNKIEELDSQIEELRPRNKWSTFMRSLKIRNKIKKDKNEDEGPEMPEVDEDGMLDLEALRLYTQHLRTIYEKKSMELNTYLGKKKSSSKSVVTSVVEDQAIKNNEDANDKPTESPDPTHEEGLNIVDERLECISENTNGVSAEIDKYKLEIDDLKNKIEGLESQIKKLRSRNKWKTFMRSLKIKFKTKEDKKNKIEELESLNKELRSRNKWNSLMKSLKRRFKMKEDKIDDNSCKMPEVAEDGMLDLEALRLYTQHLRTIYEKKSMELNTYLGKKESSSKSVVTSEVEDQAIKNNEDANDKPTEPPDPTHEEGLSIVDERLECIPENVTGVSADIDKYKLEIDDLKNKIEELDSQIEELRPRNKWSTFMRSLKIRNKIKEDKNEDEAPKMPEVDEDGMLDVEALRLYTQHLRTIYEKKSMELNTYLGKKEISPKTGVTYLFDYQAIKNNENANQNGVKPQRRTLDLAIDFCMSDINDLEIKIEELDSQIKESYSRNKFKRFIRSINKFIRSLKIRNKINEDKNDDEPPKPEVDEDGMLDLEDLYSYLQYLRTLYEKKSMELNTCLGKKKTSSKSGVTGVV